MDKAVKLFKRRQAKNQKEIAYYSKFIFNGHFIVFLSIAFGALMLQYSQMVKQLSPHINYHLIIALILSTLVITNLRTFIRPADHIFLLNFESHMPRYFKLAIMRSTVLRSIIVIGVMLFLVPLYFNAVQHSVAGYIAALALSLCMIHIGLWMRYLMMKLDIEAHWISLLIFIMTLSGTYTALEGLYLTVVPIVLFGLGFIYLLYKNAQHRTLNWHALIDYEERLKHKQNKFINMFTDVKGMKDTVKRRRLLDVLLPKNKAKYNQQHMFEFLFVRNFLRSSDALWIIIRLMLIACLVIWVVNQPIVAIIIGSFIVYAIVLQTSQFYKQQAFQLWPKVWPVPESFVLSGFKQFMRKLMWVTTIMIAIVYIVIYPSHFYYTIVFFILMLWTMRNVTEKIEKRMKRLRD
ncbi:ABC transporter permease [Macrococcoides caseolyticum]|uniref:ABC transporter permease n=1 Tax=Macrococcoides caseolyticum TaxID=69966 RepID=UPI001F2CE113|nr:ABC transporter permease [Macrococcus caseolyticus]MCE4957672.1 ABC transporter permease [Macrococcus caseolyticus]